MHYADVIAYVSQDEYKDYVSAVSKRGMGYTFLPVGAQCGGPTATGSASRDKPGKIVMRRVSEVFDIPELKTLYVSAMSRDNAAKNEFIELLETAVENKFNQIGTTEDLTRLAESARESRVFKFGSFFEDTGLFGDEQCQKLFGRYDCEDNTINVSNIQGRKIVDGLLVAIGKVFAAPGCMTVSCEDLFSN